MILEARAILDTDKIQRMVQRFRDILDILVDRYLDDMDEMELKCCASLAHHGLLSSFQELTLSDIDLSPVPTQHLASLASCATKYLDINNVRGCDLVSILTSAKCEILIIGTLSLGREETRALVQAMESRVEEIRLAGENRPGPDLDIKALTEYRGLGKCWKVKLCTYDTKKRYSEDLSKWARSRNWIEDSSVKKICNFWNFTRPGPDEMLMFLASQL